MDMWPAGPETKSMVEKAIAEWHPHLALVDHAIAVVFREKASKSGGRTVLGRSKKSSSLIQALVEGECEFILEIACDQWQELNDTKRMALIDHLLCYCQVEEKDDGSLKYSIRKPDIQMFSEEVKRHGVWMPLEEEGEDDNLDEAVTTLQDVFGSSSDSAASVDVSLSSTVTRSMSDSESLDDVLN